jgi:hypothetical protein
MALVGAAATGTAASASGQQQSDPRLPVLLAAWEQEFAGASSSRRPLLARIVLKLGPETSTLAAQEAVLAAAEGPDTAAQWRRTRDPALARPVSPFVLLIEPGEQLLGGAALRTWAQEHIIRRSLPGATQPLLETSVLSPRWGANFTSLSARVARTWCGARFDRDPPGPDFAVTEPSQRADVAPAAARGTDEGARGVSIAGVSLYRATEPSASEAMLRWSADIVPYASNNSAGAGAGRPVGELAAQRALAFARAGMRDEAHLAFQDMVHPVIAWINRGGAAGLSNERLADERLIAAAAVRAAALPQLPLGAARLTEDMQAFRDMVPSRAEPHLYIAVAMVKEGLMGPGYVTCFFFSSNFTVLTQI